MSSTQRFLLEIERFLKRHDMAPATFGDYARGDRSLVRTLRMGRSPSLETVDRVREYMARYDAEHPRPPRRQPPRRRKSSAASVAA